MFAAAGINVHARAQADSGNGRDIETTTRLRKRADSIYAARCAHVMRCDRLSLTSAVDGLTIPARLFAPLQTRGRHGHAAMVWVHGGMHDFWDERMLAFVREAVERGYVVIAPDYRGSSGYGPKLYDAADYGGRELDDVLEAAKYLRKLSYVDPSRIGIMGWSHGGLITLLLLCRSPTPFAAGAAIVPVSDLIFRSAFKGPTYQRDIAPQPGFHGLPFQNRRAYVARSPALQVDSLHTPVLVHVATNDDDVDYAESRRLVDALLARKPSLAEVRVYDDVYVDMYGDAHTFSRRVNPITLTREDSPEQRDSWNRTWTFFEWWLRPYEDRSR